jgi:hypothetical protein
MKCLNEVFIDLFHFLCCVNMVDRHRLGKETMTGSLRRERQAANPMPKWGQGCMNDGEGTSQIDVSQVIDPSKD